jgi:hypothetical protein
VTTEHKGDMGNTKRVAHASSPSKIRTMLLRKLLEAVKRDAAAKDRTNKQLRAAYERQEAELVRSLEHTRRVLVLLRGELTTEQNEGNPVN